MGLRVGAPALRDRRRPVPGRGPRRSSPKAGASRRRDAPSAPAQSMRSEVRSGIDWFELHGDGRFRRRPIGAAAAAARGVPPRARRRSTLDDGSDGMVPEEWLRRCAGIAGVGEATGDHVRFKLSQAALLDAVLAAQPAVRVDERFARVRDELSSFSGIGAARCGAVVRRAAARVPARGARLVRVPAASSASAAAWPTTWGSARPSWCWRCSIALRATREATSGPSLVVVPRSLVFNWKEEAARFAPKLRVLDFTGAERDRSSRLRRTTSC